MKFNKKCLCSSVFSLVLLQLSQSNNIVFASGFDDSNIYNNFTYNTLNEVNKNYKFSFLTTHKSANDDLITKGCNISFFNLREEYPYFKIWVNNTSDVYYNAVVTRDSDKGPILCGFKIDPHDTMTFNFGPKDYINSSTKNDPSSHSFSFNYYYKDKSDSGISTKSIDTYKDNTIPSTFPEKIYISVTSQDGSQLKGYLSARVSTNEEEIFTDFFTNQ